MSSGGAADWKGLLEALHSALIDELTERHPEPKPELGMPSRHPRWETPDPRVSVVLVAEACFGPARGLAAIAFDAGLEPKLASSAGALWSATLKRAGGELQRRGIKPAVSDPAELKAPFSLPAAFPAPSLLIWIPVRLAGKGCYLGVGK